MEGDREHDWDEVLRLVEEERIDDVLSIVSHDEIARAWCAYTASGVDSFLDPNWWAIELWMSSEWWRDKLRIRTGLLHLVAAAHGDERMLDQVGAGPLELFVGDELRLD